MIPGFVINLDRDTDIYRAFTKHFQTKNKIIQISRFSAIDGKMYRSGRPTDLSFYAQHFATNKAIGCFKSHLSIWQQVVDQNLPFAVIFEDDVIPVDPEKWEFQIQATIQKMQNSNTPWDVILLGYHSQYITTESDKNFFLFQTLKFMNYGKQSHQLGLDNDDIISPVTFAGTHAYVVSRAGARKLLKECSLIGKSPIDIRMAALHVQNKINIVANVRPIIETHGASEHHYVEWILCEGILTIGNYEIKLCHFAMLTIVLLLLFLVTKQTFWLSSVFFALFFFVFLIYPQC